MDFVTLSLFSYTILILDFYRSRQIDYCEIDNETDQSNMESFLLAMLSKERTRNARRRDRSVLKSRKAGLRILRTPITEPPTGNRFFLYRYRLLDTAFLACKIALRRRIVFESQRRVETKKNNQTLKRSRMRNINARDSRRERYL